MTFSVDFLRALWGEARLRDEWRVSDVFSMYRDVLHDGCRATLTEIATEFYGLRRSKVIAGPEVRRHMGLNAAFFAALAAVGFRRFGFERGVHRMGPLAVDGWGNLGHIVISAFGLLAAIRSDAES